MEYKKKKNKIIINWGIPRGTDKIFLLFWIMGIVLASGFWSTFFSIFFPPWALYLSVEQLLIYFAII